MERKESNQTNKQVDLLFDDFWLYIYSLFRLVDLSLDEYEELQRAAQERADIVAKYDKVMCINP